VLSYDGTNDGATAIRGKYGLPATGTEISDGSGLGSEFVDARVIFDRDAGDGDGSGWGLADGSVVFTNWVDGVFFATFFHFDPVRAIAPIVIGVPSGGSPRAEGTEDTAVWSGKVAGRQISPLGHVDGKAKLTYDFGDASLDVLLHQLNFHPRSSAPVDPVANISWDDLSVSEGVFGDCSGSGNCVRGRFYYDNEGTWAESAGGVFRHGKLRGAFGAERE